MRQRRCESPSGPQPQRDQQWPALGTQLAPCSEEAEESLLARGGLPAGATGGGRAWGREKQCCLAHTTLFLGD